MTMRCVVCVGVLAALLVSGAAAAADPSAGRATSTSYAASIVSAVRAWALPIEAPRSGEESFFAMTKWLVPPQHKKDFASAFLKTKEQVLRANGGVKRVDLLEPAMDLANFIYLDLCEFEDEKAYKEHCECDAVKDLMEWVCNHNVVFFHTPITPVKGGGETASRSEALLPAVIKELEAMMGGELGLGTMAGAAQSPDELAWQLDARAATRVKGGRGGLAGNGGDSDKVVLLTKYFVPPSAVSDFKNKWVGLKDESLASEEGTQEYGIFNPCVTNAIYFSYEVYADWGAAKTHLAEDFVDGWWKYTRHANIPVKALPLVFVTE